MPPTSSVPRLRSASRQECLESLKEYQSGASYIGVISDNKKIGRGLFIWPNGARYEGDFLDNVRCGRGTQVWTDNSEYCGEFLNDLRHGKGTHKWSNGETYSGDFYKDRRHGSGTYRWPDGSSFTGTFYLEKKEGFGTFVFRTGDKFEGLYKQDEREGPGVFTHSDGSQDVGLWHGEKLVKLCFDVTGGFTMNDHQEYDYNPEHYVTEVDLDDDAQEDDIFQEVISPPAQFDYFPESKIAEETESLYSEQLDQRSVAMKLVTFDENFFGDSHKNILNERGQTMKVLNNTPSCTTMLKHIHRHRFRQNTVKFDIQCILKGSRGRHESAQRGSVEQASERLILAAMKGDLGTVTELLASSTVCVDVSDKHGQTALLGAAVNCHHDVIDFLLDNGADVNELNDGGISALAACHIFFYPIESFKYNIAERHNEPVPDIEVSDADTKGILANKSMTSQMSAADAARHSADSGFPPSAAAFRDDGDVKSRGVIIKEGALSVPNTDSISRLSAGRGHADSHAEELSLHDTEERISDHNIAANEKTDNDSLLDSEDGYLDGNLANDKTTASEFGSDRSVKNFDIEVSDQLIERCATQLSMNERVVSAQSLTHSTTSLDSARSLAIKMSQHTRMESTIRLLLKRGADPNASCVPMPILFFAIKAADVEAVNLLLSKGADTNAKLSQEKGGLAPLHIAVAIPGEEGVLITELLLNALASPDVRASKDDAFLNKTLEDEWIKDAISESSQRILGGRAPLHIACARDDNYKHSTQVVHLLLDHHADPNVLCNGHSPLSLAIASGNDMAIDELLQFGADPSLSLTHGIGSALCVATSTEYEHRRSPQSRIALVDKLTKAGANILTPILIGPKRINGTALDFAYYMFNLDRRIAHMPYHALTHAERDTYNARRKLLGHVGEILRGKAVERERARLEEEEQEGFRSVSPSPGFAYIGAGADLPPGVRKPKASRSPGEEGHVSFKEAERPADGPVSQDTEDGLTEKSDESREEPAEPVKREEDPRPLSEILLRSAISRHAKSSQLRKPLFKYCYECGRSVGIRLSACTRCKEVYYCSKSCKLKAWNSRHKDECIRVAGRSPSPGQKGRESPTPANNPDKGKITVKALMSDKHAMRIKVPFHGKSKSAKYIRGRAVDPRDVKTGLGQRKGQGHGPQPQYEEDKIHSVHMDNYSFV